MGTEWDKEVVAKVDPQKRVLCLAEVFLRCGTAFANGVTLWIVAHQAPRSMGFSGHEYWSGLPFPSPGDLPDPGIEPRSPAL